MVPWDSLSPADQTFLQDKHPESSEGAPQLSFAQQFQTVGIPVPPPQHPMPCHQSCMFFPSFLKAFRSRGMAEGVPALRHVSDSSQCISLVVRI